MLELTRYTADDYVNSGYLPDMVHPYSPLVVACEASQIPMCVINVAINTTSHIYARICMNLALEDARADDDQTRAIDCWEQIEDLLMVGTYIQAYAALGDLAALLFIAQLRNHDTYKTVSLDQYNTLVQNITNFRQEFTVQTVIMAGMELIDAYDRFEDMHMDDATLIIVLALCGYTNVQDWIKNLKSVD